MTTIHLSGSRSYYLCKKLNIKYKSKITGWKTESTWYDHIDGVHIRKPTGYDGVIIESRDCVKILKNTNRNNQIQKQIISKLGLDEKKPIESLIIKYGEEWM